MFRSIEILLNDQNFKIRQISNQNMEPTAPIMIRIYNEPKKISQIHIHHYDKNFNHKSFTVDNDVISMTAHNFKNYFTEEMSSVDEEEILHAVLQKCISKMSESDIKSLRNQFDSNFSVGIPEAKKYEDYIHDKIVFTDLESYLMNAFLSQYAIYLAFIKLYQEGVLKDQTDLQFTLNDQTNTYTSKNYMKYIQQILKPINITSNGYLNRLTFYCMNFINFWEIYMDDGIDTKQYVNQFIADYNNHIMLKNTEILNQQKYMLSKIQEEMSKLEQLKIELFDSRIRKIISDVLENDFIEENVYVIEN